MDEDSAQNRKTEQVNYLLQVSRLSRFIGNRLASFSKTCLSHMVYGASPSDRSELSLITLLTRAEPMPQDSHKDKI
jgi:hypothetical protein